jgi:hypothetical protein
MDPPPRWCRHAAFLQQGRAADAGHRFHAVEAQENLVAHHRAAGGEGEGIEPRMRADGASKVETCSALAPSPISLT